MSRIISDLKFTSTLVRFSSLKLPNDLAQIRAISHPKIRAMVMANLINRDKISLQPLMLTKEEMLEIAPHLTFVDCRGCFSSFTIQETNLFLQSLSANVETLVICNDAITHLPPLPKCKILDCSDCRNLTRLSELPSCQTLDCSFCRNLLQLPKLPLCQTLNCKDCDSFRTLPELPLCQTFNCKNCSSLGQLPKLPLCQTLDCSLCRNLLQLPKLPLCQTLNCTGCDSFRTLPELPLCQTLNCSYCRELRQLSELPLCQTLNCYFCRELRQLSELPLCQALNCARCRELRQLPELPLCQALDCARCRELRQLPELPRCENIICSFCDALDLNTVPQRLRQQVHQNRNEATVQIRVQDLNEDPLSVLLSLEATVLERRFLPKIQFIEKDGRTAEGADAGGVSRLFISRLMESLISRSNEPKQLAFKEMDSGLHMPLFDTQRHAEVQLKGFQILGALFDQCIGGSGIPSVTIGTLFDQELFQMIVGLSFEDLQSIDLSDLDPTKIPIELKIKLMANSSEKSLANTAELLLTASEKLTPPQFETLREIAMMDVDSEEKLSIDPYKENPSKEEEEEMVSFFKAKVQISLSESIENQDVYIPIILIAKQMQLCVGTKENWELLCQQGGESLDTKIQGVLDPEQILTALNWSVGDRTLDQALVDKTKGFVERWIKEAQLKNFMNFSSFVTGSPTLKTSASTAMGSPNPEVTTKLYCHLYNTPPENLPSTHSCSNTLDLTINYENYEQFKEKLETALANVSNRETSGFEII